MTLTLNPRITPKLGPTPIVIPVLQTYVLGDFMRAFGIDEHIIQNAQRGYDNGDFTGIVIRGLNGSREVVEQSTLYFADVLKTATQMVDTSSQVSITEQLSRRLAQTIVSSAATMRRRGLTISYGYMFTTKALNGYSATMARYELVPFHVGPPAGMALRDVYTVSHKPTGATVTHASARLIG